MADRELADKIAEAIHYIWTDPKTVKGMNPKHGKKVARFFLHHAMRHADVPPRLFALIELMLWDAKEGDAEPKLPVYKIGDYFAFMKAVDYEASQPPDPTGVHPSKAKQKDTAKRAGVTDRTIRRWQKKNPLYREFVSAKRKAETGG